MFIKKIINRGINKGYDATACELCHSTFNPLVFDRIHKCKRCLKYVCHLCGDAKMYIIDDEEGVVSPQKHRVCKVCKQDIDLINQTMNKYAMKWQKNSNLAKQWVRTIQKLHNKDYEYEHFLNYFHKSGVKFSQEIQIIDKDVIRGRTDFSVFNYSMKEFFYTIQISVEDQHTTRLNIANVLYGIAARYEKVGYCQGMSGIAAFLLCFASEETSYIIFCDLIENIFPPLFLQRNSAGVPLIGLMAEIYFLKEYYWIFIQKKKPLLLKQRQTWYSQDEMQHTKMIIQLAGMKALLSIFIGQLSFTNCIFVWEEMKNQRNFQVVEKAFLAVIYLNRVNILEERSFKKLQQFFEKLDSYVFQQTYHDIEVDQQIKKQLIEQFYVQNNKKYGTSKTGNAYTLSKATNFTQKQIKQLQKLFCQGFSQEQFTTKSIIEEQQFIELIELYYTTLKNNSVEEEQILEVTPAILQQLFRNYQSGSNSGLLFRQFINCFAICTKNSLKERISAIVIAFEGQQNICLENLYKILTNLMNKVPKNVQNLKILFMNRMKNFFLKKKYITSHELNTLLSDLFINQMDAYIKSECDNIVSMVIEEYKAAAATKKDEKKEEGAIGKDV